MDERSVVTMSKDFSVHVEHVTRVEGHGNIVLDVKNGKIEKLQWNVVEAPRFFEAMLRGQQYNELRPITSRICGICSIGHSLASLKATEDALGCEDHEADRDTASFSDSCREHAESYPAYRISCRT